MRTLYIIILVVYSTTSLPVLLSAQDCSSPGVLCADQSQDSIATATGLPTPLPDDYCFQSENAVFYSFSTLDNVTYPGITFNDPRAFIDITGLNCNTDTTMGQTINMAVFLAVDPCDESTYEASMVCATHITNDTLIEVAGLQPATTYYIVLSGDLGNDPANSPAECVFSLNISGPAVTYDLMGDPFEQFVFLGQTAEFSVNPALGPYLWEGENLAATTGSENTASPQEPNKAYWYSATTTIDGCEYTYNFVVNVRPAILVYNVMTPNGDGINDFFEIERNALWPNAQIWIYNRWGQKVYQTIHYQNNWDGDGLPAGVYYYVIELNEPNLQNDTYTGSLTILR